jgi:hypothetical protein
MPDTITDHPQITANDTNATSVPSQRHDSHLGAVQRGWFQHLQALEDAIAYRQARVSAPCPDCTAGGQTCDDHACDLNLIAAYQRTAIAVLNASSQTDAIRGNQPASPRGETRRAQPSLP